MNKQSLRETYNNHAEQRNSNNNSKGLDQWKIDERAAFLNRLMDERKHTLLEIGAGTGRDSLFFAENGLDVLSVDLSDEMVRLCQDKGLNARRMDFYDLDATDDSFDAVFALNCLLHVPKEDIEKVLNEIRRVLKPDGLFFYGVYGGSSSNGIWEKDSYEPKRFFAMYSDDELTKLAEKHFNVLDFHTIPISEGAPHFQSLTLRNSKSRI